MNDLERIARLLCIADGFNPDDLLLPYPPAVGPRGLYVIRQDDLQACWHSYQNYVQATLDAVLAGADDGDLRQIIEHVISGEEIPDAPPDEMPDPAPVAWRLRYHL
jgi:hypothetical protein